MILTTYLVFTHLDAQGHSCCFGLNGADASNCSCCREGPAIRTVTLIFYGRYNWGISLCPVQASGDRVHTIILAAGTDISNASLLEFTRHAGIVPSVPGQPKVVLVSYWRPDGHFPICIVYISSNSKLINTSIQTPPLIATHP